MSESCVGVLRIFTLSNFTNEPSLIFLFKQKAVDKKKQCNTSQLIWRPKFEANYNLVPACEIRLIDHFVINSRGELLVAKENLISIVNRKLCWVEFHPISDLTL